MAGDTIPDSWRSVLEPALASAEARKLGGWLKAEEAAGKQVYPPRGTRLAALALTPLDAVRCVILGQDPYHGPGQVVGYPIMDLENFFTDIHKYLRLLEEMVILTLAQYGLKAERSEGETGVWLDPGTPFARKICAMGVRASRWVTMHGFALNVNADLGYFDHMIPCGIKDKAVTSLNVELGVQQVSMEDVKASLLKHFLVLFNAHL